MDDDLNTPVAIGVMFDAIRRANVAVDGGDTATAATLTSAVREMCAAVGLRLDIVVISSEMLDRAKELDAARSARDFATADAIRNELQALGYLVETTKDGTRLRKR